MVYCGKPSKGCQECRARRTKCDLLTPSCSQYVRAGRKCFGYRDVPKIAFRDETEAIAKKVQAQALSVKKNTQSIVAAPPFFSMQPSVEDRAMALFLSNYVVGKSRSFEYINVFYTMPVMDEHLASCISAVSLADLAEELRSDELLRRARKQYIHSLRSANLALRDKSLVARDSTLLAVLLLDLFEKITARHNRRPLAALTEHIDGATRLMVLRGSMQFCSEAGTRMFNHVLYLIVTSCVIRKVNIPPDILVLLNASALAADGDYIQWRQIDVMIRYVELRADSHSGKLSDHEEIMTLAEELDNDCAKLAQSLEDMWPYKIYFTEDLTSTYEGVYHVYDINFHQLKVWNSIRGGRININEILQAAYLNGLKLSPPSFLELKQVSRFEASLKATLDVSLELCRAVPQFCFCLPESYQPTNAHGEPLSAFQSCAQSSSFASMRSSRKYSNLEQASAYTMIHPLNIVVQSSAGKIPKVRAWILDRLKFIGIDVGLKDALSVAKLIEAGSDIDLWMVFASLAGHDAPVSPFDAPSSVLGKRTKATDGRPEKQEYLTLV